MRCADVLRFSENHLKKLSLQGVLGHLFLLTSFVDFNGEGF